MMKENIKSVGADASVRPTSKTRQNKGITLIALVITIIVMLILVAVTINMAVNGGLFSYAGKAVGETQNAMDVEQELANGKIQVDGKWYGSIEDYIAGKELVLSYDETEKDANGMLTANATYESDGYIAVIPKGFKISDIKEEQTIENGLVIQDEDENEFVWIPVKKAIVTESEIEQIKEDSNDAEITDLEAVQTLVDSGIIPMAVQAGTDYKGLLYYFQGTDTLTLKVQNWETSYYTEPTNLSDSFDNSTNVTDWTSNLYQNAYNKTVKSVSENGGFYVGRYEISLYTDTENTSIKYAQSKKEQTPLVNTTWYEMYKYEKAYAQNNSNLGVTSEMIWGSQWDQMMLFVNGKYDGAETPEKFYIHIYGSRNSDIDSLSETGTNIKDKVANIFDLEGGAHEWTQEARIYGNSRSYRGRFL